MNMQSSPEIPKVSKNEKKSKKQKEEVKRPGFLHRKLDDAFGSLFKSKSRWEKEVAYLDSQEEPKDEKEEVKENMEAEEAVKEMTEEIKVEVISGSTDTEATVSKLEEEVADDPELSEEVAQIKTENQENKDTALEELKREEHENLEIMKDQRNKIKEVLAEAGIKLPEDDEARYLEGIREKINEWNVADSKDYFQDSDQIKESFKQVHEQIVKDDEEYVQEQKAKKESFISRSEPKQEETKVDEVGGVSEGSVVAESVEEPTVEEIPQKEFSDVEKEQMQEIKNIIKREFPKDEDVSDLMSEKIKDIIHEQNEKDSADYFGNVEKITDAYHQVLEAEHPVVAEQVKNISDVLKEENPDGVSNKVLHDVRRKINDWNVMDAKNHFENLDQIKEAYKQVKES